MRVRWTCVSCLLSFFSKRSAKSLLEMIFSNCFVSLRFAFSTRFMITFQLLVYKSIRIRRILYIKIMLLPNLILSILFSLEQAYLRYYIRITYPQQKQPLPILLSPRIENFLYRNLTSVIVSREKKNTIRFFSLKKNELKYSNNRSGFRTHSKSHHITQSLINATKISGIKNMKR